MGCSSEDGTKSETTETGGSAASGGAPGVGGTTGGALPLGGTETGGLGSGGTATGGVATGGTPTGGTPMGGSQTGGAVTGGSQTGGAETGGAERGGAETGGAETGGAETGGAEPGGAPSGGAATGGAPAGGVTGCDIGVHDPSNPPEVLPITAAPGSHDPAAIEANGTFYLFSTSLFAWTSNNLTSWQNAPRAFGIPAWASQMVPGVVDLWAPGIEYFGGQYHLYYSASTFGSNRSCIGHATRASMDSGSWTDQGSPVICSNVDDNVNYNAIDPDVIIDTAGNPWLDFGSFWTGIQIIPLDDQGQRVGTEVTNIANRGGPGIEGPAIVYRCGYYYLFTSWDTCCQGASSTYNIRVVRSANVTGPYEDQDGTSALNGGGTLIAETNGEFAGPGGQSVLITGTDAYLVYHAYRQSNGGHQLRIAELVWDSDGWPVPVGP